MAERDPLKPIYLIHGSDRPKVDLAVRRLRARVETEGGSVETLAADAREEPVDGAAAGDACNAMGLFGGLRLVLVTGVEAWGAADARAIAGYLAAPAPDTVLALTGERGKSA